MQRRGLLSAALAAALLLGCKPAPTLEVSDAWLRAPLPGQTVAAGYFTLRNNTDRPATLVSMSSPAASRVELHTHQLQGDMMQMRRLDHLEIAGRHHVVLAPGGQHLMLFDVQSLSDPVTVTLEFNDGTVLNAQFDIRDLKP